MRLVTGDAPDEKVVVEGKEMLYERVVVWKGTWVWWEGGTGGKGFSRRFVEDEMEGSVVHEDGNTVKVGRGEEEGLDYERDSLHVRSVIYHRSAKKFSHSWQSTGPIFAKLREDK